MLEIGASNDEERVGECKARSKVNKQYEILFIMFTVNNDGIFEFFGKCLWLFHKLWIEMKAQSLDFERVKKEFLIFLSSVYLTDFFANDKSLTALKDSLYKILSDTNKVDQNSLEKGQSSIIRRKLNDLNSLIETWKYDFIKNTKNRFDKTTLLPLK